MRINKETQFNIGDEIYHITKESPRGVIIDIRVRAKYNDIQYYVVWAHDLGDWYDEYELSKSQTF